ncbi:MAG TPA: hypothetical protein VIM73_02750 [Polyangiaceae bacterium]
MLHRYTALGAALALVALAAARPANAQSERPIRTAGVGTVRGSGAAYEVDFFEDQLAAEGLIGTVPRIRVRPPAQRTLLIRARTSFVSEMLKSVENM